MHLPTIIESQLELVARLTVHSNSMRLLAIAALVLPLAVAQLPTSAPSCAAMCMQVKIQEAPALVPGIDSTSLAALCASDVFTHAYSNCLKDNCVSVAGICPCSRDAN